MKLSHGPVNVLDCGLDYFPVRGGARLLCSRTTPA
jgi:hypothetical protein